MKPTVITTTASVPSDSFQYDPTKSPLSDGTDSADSKFFLSYPNITAITAATCS